MKVKSESEVAQSCPTLSDPMDCSPPGSCVHGIFQARVLEWVAIITTLIPQKNLSTVCIFVYVCGYALDILDSFFIKRFSSTDFFNRSWSDFLPSSLAISFNSLEKVKEKKRLGLEHSYKKGIHVKKKKKKKCNCISAKTIWEQFIEMIPEHDCDQWTPHGPWKCMLQVSKLIQFILLPSCQTLALKFISLYALFRYYDQ